MQVHEAEARLKQLLNAAGGDARRPNPLDAWRVFKQFAAEPVDCAEDGLLFQCGVYDFSGAKRFHFDLVRQFTVADEHGDYDHMEQLHCEFTCAPTPALRKCKAGVWREEFDDDTDQFFAAVENMPEFQAGTQAQAADWSLSIWRETV